MSWREQCRVACLACAVAVSTACMEPARERAIEDERVGHVQHSDVSFDERLGGAVVRAVTTQQLELWASVPQLDMSWCWSEAPPESLSLEIHNVVSESALVVETGEASIERVPSEVPTRLQVSLSDVVLVDGCLGLRVVPPQADRRSPFRFALLSDVQRALDRVQDVFEVLNQQPDIDFLLGAGDLTSQGTDQELRTFQRELRQLRVPYYTTLGNHELGTEHTNFHRYFGRGSYSFEYRGVRFTLLDSASALLDALVLERLEGWLEAGRDTGHVVAMHIAPLDPIGVRNGAFARRAEAARVLSRLARGDVDLTLYGHIHSYYHFENAGIDAHISGGGGAIPERFDDVGRHFLVVSADPFTQNFDVAVVRVD